MPKLVPRKPREVETILLSQGFILNVSKSSHRQYFHPITKAHTTVPFHSRDIPPGTLRSIIRQSQLSLDLFRK
ncbi:type II toxin-antitoxin system HicA family toxin [Candidatus Gottesmanbacteria bacterium]|nr:type II toxin-antitoxin system HicA family toxin [Candidatus Gottesmanbacteria bacterium]